MENTNNTDQNEAENPAAYAGLGVNNQPDSMNHGDDEAADTLLYTDTVTARHATDEIPNSDDPDELPADTSDEELDAEITELAEEEDAGNERY